MPVRDAAWSRSFLVLENWFAQSAVVLRIVKTPPHEVGGSSWLEVALDLIVSRRLSSELKRDRTLARG